MLERLGTLLLVASFGFAMAQTAIAQDNDSHDVTINVKDIAFLDVKEPVSLKFNSFDSETNGTFASASASTTYEVRTNRSGVSLEVSVTNGSSEFQNTVEELGLTVKADTPNSNNGQSSFKITTIDGDSFNSGKLVDENFGPLSDGNLNLKYEGEITENFPKNENKIEVQYTITE